MRVRVERDWRNARRLLRSVCRVEYLEILRGLRGTAAPEPLEAKYPIRQGEINRSLNAYWKGLPGNRWLVERQLYLTPTGVQSSRDRMTMTIQPDVRQPSSGLAIEVEFGNVASMHRDFAKFRYMADRELLTVAVLIVPTDRLASLMDNAIDGATKALKIIGLDRPPYPLLAMSLDLGDALQAEAEQAVAAWRRTGQSSERRRPAGSRSLG